MGAEKTVFMSNVESNSALLNKAPVVYARPQNKLDIFSLFLWTVYSTLLCTSLPLDHDTVYCLVITCETIQTVSSKSYETRPKNGRPSLSIFLRPNPNLCLFPQ